MSKTKRNEIKSKLTSIPERFKSCTSLVTSILVVISSGNVSYVAPNPLVGLKFVSLPSTWSIPSLSLSIISAALGRFPPPTCIPPLPLLPAPTGAGPTGSPLRLKPLGDTFTTGASCPVASFM